jgi:WD40 repeat protein
VAQPNQRMQLTGRATLPPRGILRKQRGLQLILGVGRGRVEYGPDARKFFVAIACCMIGIAPEVRVMKVRGSLGLLATLLTSLFPRASSADAVKELAVLEAPARSWVTGLAFSADGARLASSGTVFEGPGKSVNQVTAWDVAKQEQVCVTEDSKSRTAGLGVWISPDYKTIVVRRDSEFRVWDGATGIMRGVIAPKEFSEGFTAAALSPDRALFAVARVESFVKTVSGKPTHGSRVGDIAIWDMKTVKVTATLPGTDFLGAGPLDSARKSPSWVEALAFSPDGAQLAAVGGGEGDARGKVKLWNLKTAKVTATLKGADKFVAGKGAPLEWLADGKSLVLHQGTSLDVWDTAKGEHTDAFSLTGLPLDMPMDSRTPPLPGTRPPAGDSKQGATPSEFEKQSVLSADGTRLAVQMVRVNLKAKPPTMESEVVVWDVAARRPQGAVKLKVSAERLKALATMMDLTKGRLTTPFQGYAVSIALSPDGKLLAIGSAIDANVHGEFGEPVRVYDVSKLSAPAPDADAARERSKWEGKGRHEYVKNGEVQRNSSAVKLVITERSGEAFKGELTGTGALEVSGTIDKGGSVKWEVKRIIEGAEKFSKDLVGGLIGSGALKGKNMSLNWSLKGTSHRGTIELELKE